MKQKSYTLVMHSLFKTTKIGSANTGCMCRRYNSFHEGQFYSLIFFNRALASGLIFFKSLYFHNAL